MRALGLIRATEPISSPRLLAGQAAPGAMTARFVSSASRARALISAASAALLPPTQPGVCRAGAAWAGGGRRMDSLLLRDRFHFTRAIACAAGRGQAQRGCRQAGVLLGPAGSCWVLLGPTGSYWGAIGTLLGGSPGPAWQSRELGTCHQLLSPLLPAHREGGGALFPVQQAGGERA